MGCLHEPIRLSVTVEALVLLALSIVGACIGSFIGTWSLRRTRGEQTLVGRSHCDHCGHGLSFAESVPIASYLILRGRCGYCRASLDRLQLLAEVGGAFVVSSAWLVRPAEPGSLIGFCLLAALGLTLLAIAIHDLRTLTIPIALSLLTLALSVGLAARAGALPGGVVAAVVTALILEAVRRGFARVARREGLGVGDVWLISALAVWLRVDTPLAVVVACVLGFAAALIDRGAHRRAFGPWIACAAWIVGLSSGIRL